MEFIHFSAVLLGNIDGRLPPAIQRWLVYSGDAEQYAKTIDEVEGWLDRVAILVDVGEDRDTIRAQVFCQVPHKTSQDKPDDIGIYYKCKEVADFVSLTPCQRSGLQYIEVNKAFKLMHHKQVNNEYYKLYGLIYKPSDSVLDAFVLLYEV